jgi:uncharacterized protein (DUF427 family)
MFRHQFIRSNKMAKAIWNGVVIAESDETVVVEGNHYFPPDSVKFKYVGKVNSAAAWYYPTPKPAAKEIAGHVAFWQGVQVLS